MDSIEVAKKVIHTEIEGLSFMCERIDEQFSLAINSILSTSGRIIICGMGKSGIIGKKIAASFASTGTPSFFMHPGEAFHGDLGMVKPEDVFIAISNSGETEEVLKLLPFLRDNGNYVIAITGCNTSTLAKNAHCHLDVAVPKEACPHQLAPTTSTTATLVMGDALTVALMNSREFQPENFARFHPGGSLGRKLLSKVRDEAILEDLPIVAKNAGFSEIIQELSSKGLGVVLVLDSTNNIYSIITDGDLRRALECHGRDIFDLKAYDFATVSPKSISIDSSTTQAYEMMEHHQVTSLIVLDKENVVGLIKK